MSLNSLSVKWIRFSWYFILKGLLILQSEAECERTPYLNYLREGQAALKSESENDFKRPSLDTDKLYMCIGERDMIEVAHPAPQDPVLAKRSG